MTQWAHNSPEGREGASGPAACPGRTAEGKESTRKSNVAKPSFYISTHVRKGHKEKKKHQSGEKWFKGVSDAHPDKLHRPLCIQHPHPFLTTGTSTSDKSYKGKAEKPLSHPVAPVVNGSANLEAVSS